MVTKKELDGFIGLLYFMNVQKDRDVDIDHLDSLPEYKINEMIAILEAEELFSQLTNKYHDTI